MLLSLAHLVYLVLLSAVVSACVWTAWQTRSDQ